jgi:hypothetical protein
MRCSGFWAEPTPGFPVLRGHGTPGRVRPPFERCPATFAVTATIGRPRRRGARRGAKRSSRPRSRHRSPGARQSGVHVGGASGAPVRGHRDVRDRRWWFGYLHRTFIDWQSSTGRRIQAALAAGVLAGSALSRCASSSVPAPETAAFMQTCGLAQDHATSCFRFKELVAG